MKIMSEQYTDESLCEEKKRTKRLNVEVDMQLYKEMKYYSISNDTSISSITRDLWLDLLIKKRI